MVLVAPVLEARLAALVLAVFVTDAAALAALVLVADALATALVQIVPKVFLEVWLRTRTRPRMGSQFRVKRLI